MLASRAHLHVGKNRGTPGIRSLIPALAAGTLALDCGGAESINAEQREFFESSVRPVLVDHCYRCHSVDAEKLRGGLLLDSRWGWQQGGESGQVIVPGEPEKSRLVQSVKHHPDFEAMPPKSKLPEAKIQALTDWIEMGAPDPRGKREPHPESDAFDLEARKAWWSLQPLAKVEPPSVQDESWPRNDYDRFVLSKLEEKDWKPAAEANKRTWIRRVTYDLIGLPPTPSEIDDFLDDLSKMAHRKVVDRLLESPRFGEHWARKWMDLVRYAETKAFEQDYSMPHAYRYRDYLIKAFNDDVPFDQFVLEALAGDLLEKPRLHCETGENESLKGPGFVYLGGGHHAPPDLHEDEIRVFDSAIDVIGKAFLGTTIACARCHDHKFDAVTTADYYSLYGILASSPFAVQNAVNPPLLDQKIQELAREREKLRAAMAEVLVQDLATAKEDLVALANGEQAGSPTAKRWAMALEKNDEWPMPVLGKDKARLRTRESGDAKPIGSLNQHGEFVTWRTNGRGFGEGPRSAGSFVIGSSPDKVITSFVGGSAATGDLSSRIGGSLHSPMFKLDHDRVWVRAKGKGARVNLMVQHYELVGFGPTTNALSIPVKNEAWHWVSFRIQPRWRGLRAYIDVQMNGMANTPASKGPHVYRHQENAWVAIDRAMLGDRRPPAAPFDTAPKRNAAGWAQHLQEVAKRWQCGESRKGDDVWLEALFASGFAKNSVSGSEEVRKAFYIIKSLRESVPVPRYVRTLTDNQGADEPVYVRGSHKNLSSEPNPRRFLDALDPQPFTGDGSGRLAWARKVASPENPLTARVLVNRLWHHLFGRGIVFSVDDFGQMGRLPTHPELLDFLAADFIESGWSIKQMVRSLALSSIYRMSSKASPESQTMDPDNIWLQHMPIRRLTAEGIRDTILAVSGRLDVKMYGPGIPDALHEAEKSRSIPKKPGPIDGDGRRSVYLELRRNFLPAFLTTFDMPNASTPFGRRNVTTVPAQSLALMNDPFVIGQAGHWAKQILLTESSFQDRVHDMHVRAFGRPASEHELEWAETTFEALTKEIEIDSAVAPEREEVWKDFCHVILNRKELIYIN